MIYNQEVLSWSIVIEHGTILEKCAIAALLEEQSRDGDFYTYVTSDKGSWVEFQNIQSAMSREIRAEEMKRHRIIL